MPISIVTRAYKTSELKNLISVLSSNNEVEKEIVAVCNINDYNIKNVNLITEDSNRFEARITGIKNTIYDKVLLLDSDQIPEKGLLKELNKKKNDMVIIPEKSMNHTFTSRCLDDWRYRNEKRARKNITPYIPVIPRFFRKNCLLSAINKLSVNTYKILSHEDSVLYYYTFKETKDIDFAQNFIFNYDPNFVDLMHKAYLYGKYRKNAKDSDIPEEISLLLNKLNRDIFNLKELGFGKGYVLQVMRGIPYELGKIFSK